MCVNTIGGHYCSCYENYEPQNDAKYDLLFVVDTSDSVTNATWRYYTNFIVSVLDTVPISNDHVRAGLVTYSVAPRWETKFTGNKRTFITALSGATRGGQGQYAAEAAKFVLDEEDGSGRRSGLHMVVIWLTDGRTSDSRLHLLDYSRQLQASSWCSVFAIGIGADVSAEEMYFIGGDLQHYTVITDLDKLSYVSRVPPLNEFLGIFLPGSYSQVFGENGSPIFGACGFNECEDTIHGCSNGCVDKPNGYKCQCPDGQALGHDGKTCYPNACEARPCAFNDGCHSNNGTATCFCGQFMEYNYALNSCVDFDECRHENGGCSHTCTNQQYAPPICSCSEGMVVEQGTRHCIADPCLDHNCEHGCTTFQGGARCECDPGYILDQDGRTCKEFSRCDLDNGGCEFNCVLNSSPTTFHCECPLGLQLREDGKTCGISCHTCSWATSEEECDIQGFRSCGVGQNSCIYEQRIIGNETFHSKGCQQPHACLTAQAQNSAIILGDKGILQCNNGDVIDSICTFCCLGEMCNVNYASYINFAGYYSGSCPLFDNSSGGYNDNSAVEFIGLPLNPSSYSIGARARTQCPAGTNANNHGTINCNFIYDHHQHIVKAQWSSPYNYDQAGCTDVDECQVNPCANGCQNYYGSHVCYCQRDQQPECNPKELDILFIVDQSANILPERFSYFKDFIKQFLMPVVISDAEARVGLISSSDEAMYDIELESGNNIDTLLSQVRLMPCCSGDSNIGQALALAADIGEQTERPLHVIILSDGLASDVIDESSKRLRSVADHVSVVGIFRANMNQMNTIAGTDSDKGRAILVTDYADLNDIIAQEVRQTFCPEGSLSSYRVVHNQCEKNECLDNNGGCQGTCHNTIGSYVCNCSHGKVLASDGHSCVPDHCRTAGLNCNHQCVNDLTVARCTCPEHFTLGNNGRSCVDLNECDDNNGGCQEHCVNLSPGYQCACYATKMLDIDQKSCIHDPCHQDPTKTAVINGGGGWRCDCKEGYRLNNLNICEDIDECQIDNWCQHECTNSIGGWQCLCPEGKVLRDDGKTCGIQCYHCEGAATNAECNAQSLETCSPNANSCQNEVRINHGVKQIFKRCKQSLACQNNYIQNPPEFLAPPGHIPEQSQCNDKRKKGTNLIENSVCRCCCYDSKCNWAEKPCHVANDCSRVPSIRIALENSDDMKFDDFSQMKVFGNELLAEFALDKTSVSLITYDDDESVILDKETEVGKVLDTFNNLENLAFGGNGKSAYGDVLNQLGDGGDATTILVMSDVDSDVPLSNDIYVIQVQQNTTNADNRQVYSVNSYDQLSNVIPSLAENICREADVCGDAGCSHNCFNHNENPVCYCPKGLLLHTDYRTCMAHGSTVGADMCSINNFGCQQRCLYDPSTLPRNHCGCEQGFVPIDEGYRTCQDVNECDIDNGGCSDECFNYPGGHMCYCSDWKNFRLGVDQRTCEPICDRNFVFFGHGCWNFKGGKVNWINAQMMCKQVNAELATAKDQNDLRLIADQIEGLASDDDDGRVAGEKYWMGLFRSGPASGYAQDKPNDWTWESSGSTMEILDILAENNGNWQNVIFQNFVWGEEDPLKKELECIEYFNAMKENVPQYSPDHMSNMAIEEVSKLTGQHPNYMDDRYLRGKRDLTYGNPQIACQNANMCGAVYRYTGRATLAAEPCWKEKHFVCHKPIQDSFVEYQTVWTTGAVGSLYFASDTNDIKLEFPYPVKLNVWHGQIVGQSADLRTYIVSQRVNGNHYDKHSGHGVLNFGISWPSDAEFIEPRSVGITHL